MNIHDDNILYVAQEKIYSSLMDSVPHFNECVLIRGTSLARCWLSHRISYDLDFAIPPTGEYVGDIINDLSKRSDTMITLNNADKNVYAHIFCEIQYNGFPVQVSFIEDRKFHKFKKATRKMRNIDIRTVDIETLYYNKIRAVCGDFEGAGRQTLRDAFDLLVLSKKYEPLTSFLEYAEDKYNISKDTFLDNLASYQWHEILDQTLEPSDEWQEFKDVNRLQNALYDEANFAPISENYWEVSPDDEDTEEERTGPTL